MALRQISTLTFYLSHFHPIGTTPLDIIGSLVERLLVASVFSFRLGDILQKNLEVGSKNVDDFE